MPNPVMRACGCVLVPLLAACAGGDPSGDATVQIPPPPAEAVAIPRTVAPRLGDADAGWDYLRYGDFVGTGVPFEIFSRVVGEDEANVLGRTGDNALLPPYANAFEAPNGVWVAAGTTCMGCHGGELNGAFVPGLGNGFLDFTPQVSGIFDALSAFITAEYGADSPEAEVSAIYLRGARATQDQIQTAFRGVNPAMRMELQAAAHRRPADLTWSEEPVHVAPPTTLASDVPPLWNVKKKTALYYNGMGRGDLTRLLMLIGVVGIVDGDQAASIDAHAPDVMAWIHTLEPPAFPGSVDPERARSGRAVFEQTCARCHGTYGDDETYPGLWLPAEVVGTDPEYARFFAEQTDFVDWFNASWYASDGATHADAGVGYVAPPLDGIWATAPYFHNGSVPTLDAVLDSGRRPARWRRDFGSSDYDLERVGWPHEVTDETGKDVYDTTAFGFGNGGHTYGDDLGDEAREVLLEYLKTL
ncbi:MAG: hypothetical protein EP329_28615 [Deltaproteobacteria bacterium]|nr:MAG: hypothetical protein EP329_28615 [Deltaproteobacteria bacterium]